MSPSDKYKVSDTRVTVKARGPLVVTYCVERLFSWALWFTCRLFDIYTIYFSRPSRSRPGFRYCGGDVKMLIMMLKISLLSKILYFSIYQDWWMQERGVNNSRRSTWVLLDANKAEILPLPTLQIYGLKLLICQTRELNCCLMKLRARVWIQVLSGWQNSFCSRIQARNFCYASQLLLA